MFVYENITGYKIVNLNKEDCIREIEDWIIKDKTQKYFVCANPHSLPVARNDRLFDKAIKEADLVIPDGVGIVIASKILAGKIKERITGYDVFWNLSMELNKRGGYKYFFLGSTEDNLNKIRNKMKHDFPAIEVAGTYSPPFKLEFSEDDNKKMIEAINAVSPDVLWVGMTAPKQEKWIYMNKDKLNVKLMGPVGAVFDFYSGNVKRSHPWFQKHGLEWLPRLLRQPHRLWRRNFISNPVFLMRVMRYKLMAK